MSKALLPVLRTEVRCYHVYMVYEWDPVKAAKNQRKHGVTFAEAASVFLDPWALTFDDPDHSDEKRSEITMGFSSKQRALFVSHCMRRDRMRIISARRADQEEREQYAQGIESNKPR